MGAEALQELWVIDAVIRGCRTRSSVKRYGAAACVQRQARKIRRIREKEVDEEV
jgi:hypothetical protein